MTPNPLRDLYVVEKLYPQRLKPTGQSLASRAIPGAMPAAIWALWVGLALAALSLWT